MACQRSVLQREHRPECVDVSSHSLMGEQPGESRGNHVFLKEEPFLGKPVLPGCIIKYSDAALDWFTGSPKVKKKKKNGPWGNNRDKNNNPNKHHRLFLFKV